MRKVLLALLLISTGPIVYGQNADSLALVDLYNSTNGPGWTNHQGWLTGPLETWYGVFLDNTGRVNRLEIANNNLTGSLPASLGNLANLQNLTLSSNQLSGPVPASFSSLGNLQYVLLDRNRLSGPVPSFAASSASLQGISLKDNYFDFDGIEQVAQQFNDAIYSQQYTILQVGRQIPYKLSVTAGGTLANNTYRWYNGSVEVWHATGDSTYFPAVSGNYTVTVTNAFAEKLYLKSDTVAFTYVAPPMVVVNILASFSSVNCVTAQQGTFKAKALSAGTKPRYQWQKNHINVGTNSSIYTDNSLNPGDSVKVTVTSSVEAANPATAASNVIGVPSSAGAPPVLTITRAGCGQPVLHSSRSFEDVNWQLGNTVIQSGAGAWQPSSVIVAGTGTAGTTHKQLNLPGEHFIDSHGNIYISDRNNARVVKWAPGATAGVIVAGGHGAGTGLNQLSIPLGLWMDPAGNLYVVEYANNRVTKWAPGATAGTIVAGTGIAGSTLSQLDGPHSVVGDNQGNIYVTDQHNNRVTKWAPGATTGEAVIPSGEVAFPQGITIDGANNLYVVEYSAARVTKWAPGATNGIVVAGTGTSGDAPDQLSGPVGVFLDKNGVLYISDFGNNRVQRYLPDLPGQLAQTVTDAPLSRPVSASVDTAGNLFILEEGTNEMISFKPSVTDSSVMQQALTPGSYTATVSTYTGCTVTSAPFVLTACGPVDENAQPDGEDAKVLRTGQQITASVYPNPASSEAHLFLSGFNGEVTVTICDIAGKAVLQQNKFANGTNTLPLGNLAKGIYIVTVRDNASIRSFKVVVAK